MNRRDVTAFNAGLVFLVVAALGLWMAFGDVNWKLVSIAAPLALVFIGGAGLILSRTKS
ncbi:MAG: hypothetical protein HZY73_13540 [Micropruina sp.]|nr:MAG: hypothetical protein HZY73_13540 [Micropruina sp.]